MRVHPTFLTPRHYHWQFGIAVLLLLSLLSSMAFYRPASVVVSTVSPTTSDRVSVLVTKNSISVGASLDAVALEEQKRSVVELPNGAIHDRQELLNKVAVGPIPAGTVLARAFIGELVPITSDQRAKDLGDEVTAISLSFSLNAPPQGSHVAVTLNVGRAEPIIVAGDAMVSGSMAKNAVLEMSPDRAALVQVAKNLGEIGFIRLSAAGEQRLVAHQVENEEALRNALTTKQRVMQ